jgi:hypothetical protein
LGLYIIRDEDGDIIRAGARSFDYASDAIHSELMACIQGKKSAREQGIGRIILETDALQVKLSLLSADYRLTYLGGIIHDLKVCL